MYIQCILFWFRKFARKSKNLPKDSIIFMYKGGNILRIIQKAFLYELPGESRKILNNFYSQFFKRGDADFGIYLKPDLKDYQQIYDEVTYLSYYLQSKIRSYFLNNKMDFFSIYKYSSSYLSKLLREKIYNKLIEVDLMDNEDWEGNTFLNVAYQGKNIAAFSNNEVVSKIEAFDKSKINI